MAGSSASMDPLLGRGPTPVVVLLGSTLPERDRAGDSGQPYRTPLALQTFHGKPLVDHWWDALVGAGLHITTHVFVVTNAADYKPFEFWALGKGIPLSHVINTGASLGDTRVDLRAMLHAFRTANQHVRAREASVTEGASHDFLVVAADSCPPHSGSAFQASVSALAKGGHSTLFLEPPHEPIAMAPAAAGAGPVMRAVYEADAVTGLHFVRGVQISTTLDRATPPVGSCGADALTCFCPIAFLIKGEDAAALASHPSVYTTIASDVEALQHEHVELGSRSLFVVPVEAAMSWLARTRTVVGHRIGDKFQIGAGDGAMHGLPTTSPSAANAVVSAGPSRRGSSLEVPTLFAGGGMYGHTPVAARAYARVGLLGNPSDGFGGKTLSVTVKNFSAEVCLTPSADSSIRLIPHVIYDPLEFFNLRQLSTVSGREGYSGGIRLLQATLHRFFLHCRKHDIALPDRGFSVRYHTTVPRQVGLAGSSAIVTAFMRALLKFYGYDTENKAAAIHLSRDQLPSFVLAVENEELGITAGLQDRVVQAYEGLVHMDFDADLVRTRGYGTYTKLEISALPPLFLAFAADPSDSGRIHAPIKQRWLAGDPVVVDGMTCIAANADTGRDLCMKAPYSGIAACAGLATPAARDTVTPNVASATSVGVAHAGAESMVSASMEAPRGAEEVARAWSALFTANFDGRRGLFGDAALGRDNIRMVEIAREAGAAAKFPGSGGAVVGVVDVAGMMAKGTLASAALTGLSNSARVSVAADTLRAAYNAEGYVFTILVPHESPASA